MASRKKQKREKLVKLFTYGSLNSGMIESLTETTMVRPPVAAQLDNHIRIFADHSDYWSGAVASVYPHQGSTVYGALVYLTRDQFRALDEYEGGYTRTKRAIAVYGSNGNKKKIIANIYIKDDTEYISPPSRRYINSIKITLRDVGLLDKDPIDVNGVVRVKGNDNEVKNALVHIYKNDVK